MTAVCNVKDYFESALGPVNFEKTGRERHLDALAPGIEGDKKGFRKGDEDFIAFGGLDREQRGCVFEAATAIWRCREVDVGDGAYGDGLAGVGKVEDGAADEIADVVRVFVEFHAFGLGHDHFEAGERLSGVDGVDAREMEDDAALILADGQPPGGNFGYASGALRAGKAGRCQKDALPVVKTFGEIAEEFGEDLAFTALGAEKLCQDHPLRHLFRCCNGVLHKVG